MPKNKITGSYSLPDFLLEEIMICRKCSAEIPENANYCHICGAKQNITRSQRTRGNGQGTVYRRGSCWEARHRIVRDGKTYSKSKSGFEKKKDAIAWLNANSVLKLEPGQATFARIYQEWKDLHEEKIGDHKARDYKSVYEKYLKPLDPYVWDEITLQMFQNAVNKAKNTHYARKMVKTVCNQLEAHAIKNGYTTRRITTYIEIPSAQKPHKTPFTKDEIQKLKKAYEEGEDWAGIILIMIYTGMRYGEISTIKPENIHLEEHYMMGGIKTDAGKLGEIMIVPEIEPMVKKLMLPKNKAHGVSDTTFRKNFNATLVAAGCSKHTTHECRHTTATLLAEAGIQPAIIKEIMRHENYQQTLAYTHIDRKTRLDAITKSIGCSRDAHMGTEEC